MNEPTKQNLDDHHAQDNICCHCCPDGGRPHGPTVSRRGFLATAAAGGAVLSGLSWSSLAAADQPDLPMPGKRVPLNVLPILVWDEPKRRPMRSWRSWGGVQTPEAAAAEVQRITKELTGIAKDADFPIEFAQVASVNHIKQMADSPQVKAADVVIVYGAEAVLTAARISART